MAARALALGYVRIKVGWLGRCTQAGDVAWSRFFRRAEPDDQRALAGWDHEAPDLH